MVKYSEIKKVLQLTDEKRVQAHLDTGKWVILSIAPGQHPDSSAYNLFAIGSCDPDAKELPLRGESVTYI